MNKATKYAINGAGIFGIGGIAYSIIKQLIEMNENPVKKFDWGEMFVTGFKGAALGGAAGYAIGSVKDYYNEQEQSTNTDEYLNDFVNEIKLKSEDERYKLHCRKADFLTEQLISEFGNELANDPMRMGSTEKGTALKDKFDIDICLPFKTNSFSSTESMYLEILNFLKGQVNRNGITAIREQKKSIGVIFRNRRKDYKIDIVPYKVTQSSTGNTSGYLYLNSKSIFEKSSYTKTDVNALNSIRLSEAQKKIVIILKHWKRKNDLPISSHALEQYVLDAYSYYKYEIPRTLTKKVIMVLEHIKESINNNILRSIENTNNILNNHSSIEKEQIIRACKSAIEDYEYQPNSVKEIFQV